MAEYDELIKGLHKKQARKIMMSFKTTPVGKHFNDRFNQFIWTMLVFAFTAGGAWMSMRGDINNNTLFGQETRKKLNKHIEEVKDSPVTEAELKLKVLNNSDDIQDHDAKIQLHDTKIASNETLVTVMRDDQKIIKDDIKEILKILIDKKGE